MERIQKVLARLGLGSRREIEGWIEQGRIQVNGQVAVLGDGVSVTDKLELDGRIVHLDRVDHIQPRVIRYYKQEGEICSQSDPDHSVTVFRRLPRLKTGRWVMVGRLDINTTGLLLFTNDGELAHRLMHPSYQVEREYAVRVFGEVTPEVLQRLKAGVMLDDGLAKFQRIIDQGGDGSNHWYHVTLLEGRQREVRRLWESQDVMVSRLIRIRFGSAVLPNNMSRGSWQELPLDEINALRQLVSLPPCQPLPVIKRPCRSSNRNMKSRSHFVKHRRSGRNG